MLRLTMNTEEYLQIGEDIKIVFLGTGRNRTRIMLDLPKEVNVVRSKVIENAVSDPEEYKKLPRYHEVEPAPEKYRAKSAHK